VLQLSCGTALTRIRFFLGLSLKVALSSMLQKRRWDSRIDVHKLLEGLGFSPEGSASVVTKAYRNDDQSSHEGDEQRMP